MAFKGQAIMTGFTSGNTYHAPAKTWAQLLKKEIPEEEDGEAGWQQGEVRALRKGASQANHQIQTICFLKSGNRKTHFSIDSQEAINRWYPKRVAKETAIRSTFSWRCIFFPELLSSLEWLLYLSGLNYFNRKTVVWKGSTYFTNLEILVLLESSLDRHSWLATPQSLDSRTHHSRKKCRVCVASSGEQCGLWETYRSQPQLPLAPSFLSLPRLHSAHCSGIQRWLHDLPPAVPPHLGETAFHELLQSFVGWSTLCNTFPPRYRAQLTPIPTTHPQHPVINLLTTLGYHI